MSKYKSTLREEKEERLRDLSKTYLKVEDEIAPLETYKNTLIGEINTLLDELGTDEFENVTRYKRNRTLVDLREVVENFPTLVPYIVAEIDEKRTISYMYEDHLDYTISKRLVDKCIDKTKIVEEGKDEIKVKNR